MFCKRFSPVTGRDEWCEMEEDYDLRRDIARSTYGDMLHDKERNRQYHRSIRKEVKKLISQPGKVPYGLDIGTGTGLLSMMAASSGVPRITACEGFLPMAQVAPKIIEANNFTKNITVVPKSSMDVEIPNDMPEKADLVVMELFDTELIGEGLLPSMRHAHKNLVKKGATVVPAAATVYIQLLQSNELWQMHQLSPEISDGVHLRIPPEMLKCRGAPSVYDVQADELSSNCITMLTQPTPVLRMLFCELEGDNKNTAINQETVMDDFGSDQILQHLSDVTVQHSGTAHVILMWWTLQMDKEGEIVLSMAPTWLDKGKAERDEWRDHWMQGIYFLQKPLEIKKNQLLTVQTFHDDYAFWFDVSPSTSPCLIQPCIPLCTCGVHTVWSRARFAMVNDPKRRHHFYTLSRKLVLSGSKVGLVISDGSLVSLLMAIAGFEKVYVVEPEASSRRVMKQIVEANGLDSKVIFLSRKVDELSQEDFKEQVDVVLGEPFFQSSLVPWHDLYFWYTLSTITRTLHNDNLKVFPKTASLKAVGVQLKDLWKIKAPLGTVEGFNVRAFDELVQSCSVGHEENEAEPHSMWEYPCRALTDVVDLLQFDLEHALPAEKKIVSGAFEFVRKGCCNAVILWIDYLLDEDMTLSTGLQNTMIETTDDGFVTNWVKYYKQGVFFLQEPRDVCPEQNNDQKLEYAITFQPSNGSLTMKFELDTS